MIKLPPKYLETVRRILAAHVPDCEVRVFGSRHDGTAVTHSDLDLVIVGTEPLHWRTKTVLSLAFEESDLPFFVDVLDWHTIPDHFRTTIEDGYTVVQSAQSTATAEE